MATVQITTVALRRALVGTMLASHLPPRRTNAVNGFAASLTAGCDAGRATWFNFFLGGTRWDIHVFVKLIWPQDGVTY